MLLNKSHYDKTNLLQEESFKVLNEIKEETTFLILPERYSLG